MPRVEAADYLTARLRTLSGITPPVVRPDVRHGYYIYCFKFDAKKAGLSRDRFIEALKAEGIPVGKGYVEPLYLQPLYQQRIAWGRDGFPFTASQPAAKVSYARGICPVAERMHFEELISADVCHAAMTRADLDDFVDGIAKVLENADSLA